MIQLGAPEVAVEPELAGTADDPLVNEENRQFWAFQPPRQASVPGHDGENPIDAFVLRELRRYDRTFKPMANPLTLLRRVTSARSSQPGGAPRGKKTESSRTTKLTIPRIRSCPTGPSGSGTWCETRSLNYAR